MKIYGYSIPLPHYTIILTNVKGIFLLKFVEFLHKINFVGYLYKKYSSLFTILTNKNSRFSNIIQFQSKKIGGFLSRKNAESSFCIIYRTNNWHFP